MLHRSLRTAVLLGTLCIAASARGAAQAPPAITLQPYAFRTFDGREHAAELGRMTVPERRDRPGRTIEVAFVRLRSTAREPGTPVVFLAGGPGSPGIGMGRVPVYFALFERLRAHADVILLDQRGVGLSRPSLECPPVPVPLDVFASERGWMRAFGRISRACFARMRRQGIDLAGYTTEASADDVDDLRARLGYARVSLLGHSYGTVLAQAVLRRHGASVDRAVLASVDGPDDLVALPSVWDLAIVKLGHLAARDPALGGAVPDLRALYRRALDGLDADPLLLSVTDRATGRPATIRVGSTGLRWLLRTQMVDARSYATLPALLLAIERGDRAELGRRVAPLYDGFRRSAMANAVDCAIGWSHARMARARMEKENALFSNLNLQWESGLCGARGLPRRAPGAGERLFSTVPTLFVSGTLDPTTSPFQAEEVRWGFPNSTHLVVENGGHETLPDAEVRRAVADFLAGQDVSARRFVFPPPRFTLQLPPASPGRQR